MHLRSLRSAAHLDSLVPGAGHEEGPLVGWLSVVSGDSFIHGIAGVALTPGNALHHMVVLSKLSLMIDGGRSLIIQSLLNGSHIMQ